ncbi:MAG: 4-hydroxy-tetrahydrodipicolinate reductase [Pirellulales bacterium]
MSATKVAIHGAAGRMGQRLVALGDADPEIEIVAAMENPAHARFGHDAGMVAGASDIGIELADILPDDVEVVIDFSLPAPSLSLLARCVDKNIPMVIATTGFSEDEKQSIRDAAESIPILWSPSMSLAVNLVMRLTEIAAGALADLPGGADVEIVERHHRFKEDAPSGTALRFGEIVAAAMQIDQHRHGRSGHTGQRPHNEIGYHALRVGDNPGEHTIVFGMLGETIELNVKASNRDCYATGALAAAKFLAGKPAGLYGMNDVLKL